MKWMASYFTTMVMSPKKQSGVGFLINSSIKNHVKNFASKSDRAASLTLQLTKRNKLTIFQVYSPTSTSSTEDIEGFYDDLRSLIKDERSDFNIIMGDMNSKVGKAETNESSIGNFTFGERNERGERLVNFAEYEGLKIVNTFFKKNDKRRWTWRSPNGEHLNEIDYILTDKIEFFKDVGVVNRVQVGSDQGKNQG